MNLSMTLHVNEIGLSEIVLNGGNWQVESFVTNLADSSLPLTCLHGNRDQRSPISWGVR